MNPKLSTIKRYPIDYRDYSFFEKLAIKSKLLPFYCNICGTLSIALINQNNLRENIRCLKCRSINRQRQLASILITAINNKRLSSLKGISPLQNLSIYNTEAKGAIHRALSELKGYICSEYLGPMYESGEIVNGIMNQDLMGLSLESNNFDIVLSADVFEHIPDPWIAHREIYRVLKPGGRHIFTVPFYQTEFLDETRTMFDDSGNITYLKPAEYHKDPLREEGALVYNIFSLEMLIKLARLGFRTNIYKLYKPINGILGNNGLVFEAIKV